MRRPGPTTRPGLVYSLTLHPEPQGPAARTPARRGPAPAPRPRPAPPPGACALHRPRPARRATWASFFARLSFGANTPNSGVPGDAARARQFPRRRCGLSGRLPELLISSWRPSLEVAPSSRLATSHVSLQHLKPTRKPFTLIPHTYPYR